MLEVADPLQIVVAVLLLLVVLLLWPCEREREMRARASNQATKQLSDTGKIDDIG